MPQFLFGQVPFPTDPGLRAGPVRDPIRPPGFPTQPVRPAPALEPLIDRVNDLLGTKGVNFGIEQTGVVGGKFVSRAPGTTVIDQLIFGEDLGAGEEAVISANKPIWEQQIAAQRRQFRALPTLPVQDADP